jgi:6-pyruvoyltetrahydropterin/6-carboxytetrahydropterin synthase
MIIRKLFKYEASHQVFDAFSRRCSHSVHGHSYVVEFYFKGNTPDNAHMVMDFGLVKKYFHPFVDSFDHSHMLCSNAEKNDQFNKHTLFFLENNERWITLPFNSTAEMQAKMFFTFGHFAIRELKDKSVYKMPYDVMVSSVRVHETDTGYAEFFLQDINSCSFPDVDLRNIQFSEGIKKEWPEEFTEFYNNILKE